jgi:hypothetical protein
VALVAAFAGCGTPGAPQPPSLNLPDRITDLSAVRSGTQVALSWTMPKRNTDKLPLKSDIEARICRREGSQPCATVGTVRLAPAADGTFAETLPAPLVSGPARTLSYFVELKNRRGCSAGLSNPAPIVAGEAPPPVTGFAAEVRKDGVVLRWTPAAPAAAIRLHRTLLSPAAAGPRQGPLASQPEPTEQNLLIESPHSSEGRAIDTHITFGNTYEYRAQRLVQVSVDGQPVELDGELSSPIRIDAEDVFPPAIPTGLAAVATAPDPATGTEASIDLSWRTDTDSDIAGYEVYRREETTPWRRISGDQPVVGAAFHDTNVLPGHTYRYGVSAVDHAAHESGRSEEATETVPNP